MESTRAGAGGSGPSEPAPASVSPAEFSADPNGTLTPAGGEDFESLELLDANGTLTLEEGDGFSAIPGNGLAYARGFTCPKKVNLPQLADEATKTRRAEALARFKASPWPVGKSTLACIRENWSLVLLDRSSGEYLVAAFACGSWRCPSCGPTVARRTFARLAKGVVGPEGGGWPWLLVCLTFRPSDWSGPWDAYDAACGLWMRLRKRVAWDVGRRMGAAGRLPVRYIAVWERTARGWPHVHLLLHVEGLAELVRSLGPWEPEPMHVDRAGREVTTWAWAREWLSPAAADVGFGPVLDVQFPHAEAGGLAGYLAKLCSEVAGVKAYQLPTNAPKRFRRLRSSRGALPPARVETTWTGALVRVPSDRLQKLVDERGIEPWIPTP